MALCSFKLENFETALKDIELAIQSKAEEKSKFKHYTYLRALCYKQLEKFGEAEKYYNEVHSTNISPIKAIPQTGILLKYYKNNDGWLTDSKKQILSILYNQPFFKRFNISQLEQILKMMRIKIYPANNLLFIPKNEVYVILQGNAVLFSYQQDLITPVIVANYRAGSILGDNSDNGMSKHPENWIKSVSDLEICIFNKDSFEVFFRWYYNLKVYMVYAKRQRI